MNFSKIILIWCVITVMASSAAILTRLCDIPASSIGFWRVFGAGLIMLPFALRFRLQNPQERMFGLGIMITGIFLGAHFATWCWAIQKTSIANATLFVGLQPLMVPFIAHSLVKEKINKWETFGVILAALGTVWLTFQQLHVDRKDMPGILVSILTALICATYIVLGRKYRAGHHILVFSTGVFLVAAFVQALSSLAINGHVGIGDSRSVMALCALVLFPTIGGHALMMYLIRYAKPQLISFTIPAQFVLATIAAVPIFGEIPRLWFYPGAALIIAGVAIGILNTET